MWPCFLYFSPFRQMNLFFLMCFCLIQDSSKSKKHQYLVQLDLALTHWRTKMGFKSKEVRPIWTGAFPRVIYMCQMYMFVCSMERCHEYVFSYKVFLLLYLSIQTILNLVKLLYWTCVEPSDSNNTSSPLCSSITCFCILLNL